MNVSGFKQNLCKSCRVDIILDILDILDIVSMKIERWNSTNTNLRCPSTSEYWILLQPMTWDEDMRIIVSCLPPQVHATTITYSQLFHQYALRSNISAHYSDYSDFVGISIPFQKSPWLPKYWWGEALQWRYDLISSTCLCLVQQEVRCGEVELFNGATSYQQLSQGKAFKNANVQRNLPVCKVFTWNEAVIFTCQTQLSAPFAAWKRCCISRTINRRPTDQQSTRQSYSESAKGKHEEDGLHDWVGLLKVL